MTRRELVGDSTCGVPIPTWIAVVATLLVPSNLAMLNRPSMPTEPNGPCPVIMAALLSGTRRCAIGDTPSGQRRPYWRCICGALTEWC